jgi:hypothetical protein
MGAKRKTTKEFIAGAISKHGNTYNYDKTEYVRSGEKVIITCAYHGDILITPNDHLSGKGCFTCAHARLGQARRNTQDSFVKKARDKFGDTYDYTESIFSGNWEYVQIRCKAHGMFSIVAKEHLRGRGCGRCGYDKANASKCLTRDEFIQRAVSVHGNKYDYSISEYVKHSKKIKISCPEHGVFEQTPGNHLCGTICPSCAKYGFDQNKPATLYILSSKTMTKIGITNRDVVDRLTAINRSSPEVFDISYEFSLCNGLVITNVETLILRELREEFKQPQYKFDGYKEAFYGVHIPKLLTRVEELIASQTAAQAA